ncbi:MAG: polysaccharide biosynthesis/export family protein [Vicinamibacterales bacterium]
MRVHDWRMACALLLIAGSISPLAAGQGTRTVPGGVPRPVVAPAPSAVPPVAGGVATPADYVIGADDVLTVVFWRDKDMSTDVVVRPDGKITLPLLNDIDASGSTPEQLRDRIAKASAEFIEEPSVTITVKQINSRKVFITGEVTRPGPYPLTTPTTVLQLIAMAGGLNQFAQRDEIVVMRTENGQALSLPFDYAAVAKRKKLQQNVLLKPGDVVLVP